MKGFRTMKINREPTTFDSRCLDTNIYNSYWEGFTVIKRISQETTKY